MEEVVIIGAGAAGLMCGALLAEKGIHTVILEHTDFPGKKILSTGNGKCNMTNYEMTSEKYYCKNIEFVEKVLSAFGYRELLECFKAFGLITRERNGYVYPYSEQASAVREILFHTCVNRGTEIRCGCRIISVEQKEKSYIIHTDKEAIKTENLVISTGGKTFAKSGSDGSGYELARQLGHKVNKTVPALTAFICHEKYYKKVAGVRVKCKISMFDREELVAQEYGELQLTDYGISGIPVLNISREGAYILKSGRKPYVCIDFMPEFNEENLLVLFTSIDMERSIAEQLSYLLNKKLAMLLLEISQIKPDTKVNVLSQSQLDRLIHNIKNYTTYIANVKGFDYAQVTAGGVCTEEINPMTMESCICENLYFAGEMIDVDGKCGGYNLHFAWATASIASKSIAEKRYGQN